MEKYYGVYLIFLLTLFFYIHGKLVLINKFTGKNVFIFIVCSFIVYCIDFYVSDGNIHLYNKNVFVMIFMNIKSIFGVLIFQWIFKYFLNIENNFYENILFSFLYPLAYFMWGWIFFFVFIFICD